MNIIVYRDSTVPNSPPSGDKCSFLLVPLSTCWHFPMRANQGTSHKFISSTIYFPTGSDSTPSFKTNHNVLLRPLLPESHSRLPAAVSKISLTSCKNCVGWGSVSSFLLKAKPWAFCILAYTPCLRRRPPFISQPSYWFLFFHWFEISQELFIILDYLDSFFSSWL